MAYGAILGQTPIIQSDFPVGGIILWSGSSSNIPENWHLCDGTSGTPDLRNRFVLGAGATYNVGDTGGEATHTLTIEEMPSHNHSGTAASAGAHTHTIRVRPGVTTGAYSGRYINSSSGSSDTTTSSSAGAHTHSVSINNTGGGAAHNNMPPYYALCYIMKIS